MNDRFFKIFVAVLITNFVSSQTTNSIKLVSLKELKPTVLEKKGNEIFQYWEFKNDSFLWENELGEIKDLTSFRDSLELILGKDKFTEVLTKEKTQSNPKEKFTETKNGDKINAALVHSNQIGKIRKLNFLEAQLLNYQLARYPLLSHPTEFHGFILTHKSKKMVRIYFAASDQPWPPKPHIILEAIEKDLKEGWKLKFHLHNHYEPKSNNLLGILAPSMTDVQYFKMLSEEYKLEKAIITNGFNTVEIKAKEFVKLKSN